MAEGMCGIYSQALQNIIRNASASKKEIKPYSLNGGTLGNVECPICNNTGRTISNADGILRVEECSCMNIRRAKKHIKDSGLSEIMEEYSLGKYKAEDSWTKWIKSKAEEYIKTPNAWLYVHGVPGSGKTHICTAVCSELIKVGQNVKYVIWTDIVQQMRSVINEREYRDIMESLKRADTLYIDDFLKGSVSDADIKRAFEIINARYNLPSKKTIISSERSLDYVRRIDAAVAGRIKQRCKDFYIKTQDKDWRF